MNCVVPRFLFQCIFLFLTEYMHKHFNIYSMYDVYVKEIFVFSLFGSSKFYYFTIVFQYTRFYFNACMSTNFTIIAKGGCEQM